MFNWTRRTAFQSLFYRDATISFVRRRGYSNERAHCRLNVRRSGEILAKGNVTVIRCGMACLARQTSEPVGETTATTNVMLSLMMMTRSIWLPQRDLHVRVRRDDLAVLNRTTRCHLLITAMVVNGVSSCAEAFAIKLSRSPLTIIYPWRKQFAAIRKEMSDPGAKRLPLLSCWLDQYDYQMPVIIERTIVTWNTKAVLTIIKTLILTLVVEYRQLPTNAIPKTRPTQSWIHVNTGQTITEISGNNAWSRQSCKAGALVLNRTPRVC